MTYPFESPSYIMCMVPRDNLIFISTELFKYGASGETGCVMCFSPSTSVVSSVGMVPLEDLYQLNQYLQVRSSLFSACLFIHILLYDSVIWRAVGCYESFWSHWLGRFIWFTEYYTPTNAQIIYYILV